VIDPLEMIKKYSADCLRFWASSSKLGEDVWFSEKEFIAGQRFVTKLWNASRFAIANIQDYTPNKIKKENLDMIDRWLLSKLSRIAKDCTEAMLDYDFVRVRLDVENFFWHEFCDEYLEMVKDRLYNFGNYKEESIESAKYTLYTSLLTLLKLFAPVMPHITEEIYQLHFAKIEEEKSIHRSDWPEFDNKLVDANVEELGGIAVELVSVIRKYKSSKQMTLKQELRALVIECDEKMQKKIEKISGVVMATAKLKEISFGKADVLNEKLGIRLKIEE